jgi:hypothetical protein
VEFRFHFEGRPTEIRFDAARLAESHPRLRELRTRLVERAGGNEGAVDHELAFRFFDALHNFGEGWVRDMSSVLERIFQSREALATSFEAAARGEAVPVETVKARFEELSAALEQAKSPTKSLEEKPQVEFPKTEAPEKAPAAEDAEIAALLEDLEVTAEVPRVKGRKRPKIDGRRVPTRRPNRLNAEDFRRPGEKLRAAIDRVGTVIGRKISDTPLKNAWERARERVLQGRDISEVTRDEMLGKEGKQGLYDKARDIFWSEVRKDPAARQFLEQAGFKLGEQPAAQLEVSAPDVPVEEIRVSLDHILEKAQGENWRLAINGDNLQFEFHAPNSFREIVQVRHRLRAPQPRP